MDQASDNPRTACPDDLATGGRRRAALLQALVGALMGLLLFVWLVGLRVLDPSNIQWLFDSADPTTHYLGWSFFRHSAWHFPPGLNPAYGMAAGSSIVYSDSIPLMALLLKPFSPWLGEPFQYTGLWLLLCFVLQGVFAMLVAGRLVGRLLPQTLAAALLMTPFVLLKRLDGHYSLVGQWTVLWALYLYVSGNGSRRVRAGYVFVAVMAVLIHLYFAAMVLAIWVADLVRRWLADRRMVRASAGEAVIVVGAMLLVMWLSGYFCLVFSETRTPGSAGAYSMNLLSVVDSRGFSRFLPAIAMERDGQVEGAAYLGLGTMLMLIVAAVAVMRRRCEQPGIRWWPLVVVCLILVVFAISPVVTFGARRLVVLPNYWGGVGEVLRAAGRMAWPGVYVLMFVAISALGRRVSAKWLSLLLAGIVLVQVVDLGPMYGWIREHFRTPPPMVRTLRDPTWAGISGKYDRILLVPSDGTEVDWYPLALFAAEHGMAINHGYFARMSWERKEAANRKVLDDLVHGKLDPRALYILCTPEVVDAARRNTPSGASVIQVDGYTVLVPYNGGKAREGE